MIKHYRRIQAERAAGERDDSGFTLIELLIVIVVLGILAATVIFALGGVTGQSAVAACNSDAKSYETAIQAYASSSSNPTPGQFPNTTAALISTANGGPYLHTAANNNAYQVALSGDNGVVLGGSTVAVAFPTTGSGFPVAANSGVLYVKGSTGAWVQYDSEGAAGCATA